MPNVRRNSGNIPSLYRALDATFQTLPNGRYLSAFSCVTHMDKALRVKITE